MTTNQVSCPSCGRKQQARQADSIYRCDNCGGMYDGSPDEGGDYFTDPEKNAERKEEYQNRRQQRRVRSHGRRF